MQMTQKGSTCLCSIAISISTRLSISTQRGSRSQASPSPRDVSLSSAAMTRAQLAQTSGPHSTKSRQQHDQTLLKDVHRGTHTDNLDREAELSLIAHLVPEDPFPICVLPPLCRRSHILYSHSTSALRHI